MSPRLRRPRRPKPWSPSKALQKFSARCRHDEAPVLLDLGPVIGTNVAFFGEQLGCKLFIEDLSADIDRHTRAGHARRAARLAKRFHAGRRHASTACCAGTSSTSSSKRAAQALARELVRVLRPGGALLGFFCTTPSERAPFTKYEIVEGTTLRHRHHPGVGGAKYVLQNRDIIRMFDGLRVSDSFLLKSNMREILFRKRGS